MPRRKQTIEPPTLASRWAVPSQLPIDDVGRPLCCIATTYTFDAEFFESELLPRFLGLKFDDLEVERAFVVERERALDTARVAVLVDADHFDSAQTTLRWDQLAVRVAGGVQHAKVTLLAWERCVRILVASANLTRSGYRRNREMASVLDFFDDPASCPRSLAFDIFDFLGECLAAASAPDGARRRLGGALDGVRGRVRRWSMATDFQPRERPRVALACAFPGRRRSPLDTLVEMWGSRRATEVTVMTPFVGESDKQVDPVVERLLTIPRTRDATGYLVVPGHSSEADPKRQIVTLPRRFLNSWAAAWKTQPDDVPTYVVPLSRGEEPVRDLHAKAVLISDDEATLLLCGSSNFSPHGMGLGTANIEANLCFFDGHDAEQDGLRLEDRLPVDWNQDLCNDAIWPDEPEIPEEELLKSAQAHLPSWFLCATFDQSSATLTIEVDPALAPPVAWTIRFLGERAREIVPLADASNARIDDGRLVIRRPELHGINLTSV